MSPERGPASPPAVAETSSVVLVIDSATSQLVVGLAEPSGPRLLAVAAEPSGYRHGELLLPLVDRLLAEAGRSKRAIGGCIVGTGPGAFTGLRVGLATAAGIARALGRPLVGVPTGEAIISVAAEDAGCDRAAIVLLLPAGPTDRVLVRAGRDPERLAAGREPELAPGAVVVAVDLPGRAPAEALERGARATEPERFAAALLRLGLGPLAAAADRGPVVPEPAYVTLPRGLAAVGGEVRLVRSR